MRTALIFYRLGALGLIGTVGVFMEEPLYSSLRLNPGTWVSVSILFGFAVAAGVFLVFARPQWFEAGGQKLMLFSHGAALISILWLILWCFVWLAMMSNMGDKAEMFIKHTAYLHLFGVGFSMAGYATGWMAFQRGERSARFLMTVGWAVSYMAWFNLYMEPTLLCLWSPAIGGLLVVLGAYLLSRQFKPAVETPL
jgi:hypothetical protein